MKKNFLLVALLAGSLGANSFAATEIYVKASTGSDSYNGASWETAFKTVSKAIGSVQENEETIIYLEPDMLFDTGGQLDLGENKNVTIVGSNTTLRAAEKPGKEGGEGARILRAATGCNLTVKGIVFLNGRQIEYNPGGGLFFAGNTLVVDSCTFIDNESGSGGSGIASRGVNVTVRNSYFDGNYVNSGYGTGAAIVQAGVNNGEAGTLLVENCTFYRNDLNGVGTAISTKDAGAGYTNVKDVKIVNCTFLENTSDLANQAAIDISDNSEIPVKIINNTFYGNDGALRVGDIYGEKGGEVIFINNLVFANASGIFGAEGYSVADLRSPIIGYNNIIVGAERGVNEFIDDECFNDKKDQYNNRVETLASYPLSMVALATELSTDNYVPYLALTAENSDAVNAGYSTGTYADLIPTTDIRGLAAAGIRDIGAYEYGATDVSAISSVVADASDFVIARNGDQVTVVNTADRNFTLTVVDMLGRTLYTAEAAGQLTVDKQELGARCVIFVLTDGVSKKAEKVML
ncbi:right-handed parallel beta-helix repeat-containing protein [uncultured Barnesiella sp.]|uniref:right-handed parallel beta-helix repeat-containing protein n=1 Tax=uncultured Barnesiella sp. TaxID=584861 RepID=UPI00261AC93B|nr:right-handed parallel beta-helix repeat-containing protein [uncultured Barnesiella sp.]